MAKQLSKILNLEVVAGKAAPNPPLGPMLWSNGVNIGQFIQEFNGKTMELMQQFAPIDVKIRVKLSLYTDRSFDVEIIWPVTSNLILWKLKQKIGSGEPNKKKIGSLTRADLEEIAALKKEIWTQMILKLWSKLLAELLEIWELLLHNYIY